MIRNVIAVVALAVAVAAAALSARQPAYDLPLELVDEDGRTRLRIAVVEGDDVVVQLLDPEGVVTSELRGTADGSRVVLGPDALVLSATAEEASIGLHVDGSHLTQRVNAEGTAMSLGTPTATWALELDAGATEARFVTGPEAEPVQTRLQAELFNLR